jgi:hypothetical protein
MSSLLDVSRALPGRLKLEMPGSSHVQARRGGALDLLVERAVAGPKPAGHGVRAGGHSGGAVSGGGFRVRNYRGGRAVSWMG